MPELPEIETLSRQLQPITDSVINNIEFAPIKLRHPLDDSLYNAQYKKIIKIWRRAKYLIMELSEGFLIIHLGMSGRFTLMADNTLLKKHDHVTIHLNENRLLRYNDPRRFGCVIYRENLASLANLAIEPFDKNFTADYLHQALQARSTNIKTCILNGQIVVGVGNIYVSESLFLAKIHPLRSANSITLKECKLLLQSIHKVLTLAINSNGSSLRDFVNISGEQGYATQNLLVYDREHDQCTNNCGTNITTVRIAGRNTFYCESCQPFIAK